MKDTLIYAYVIGFVERLQSDAFGRTHETNQDWNDAYDRGRGLAPRLVSRHTPD